MAHSCSTGCVLSGLCAQWAVCTVPALGEGKHREHISAPSRSPATPSRHRDRIRLQGLHLPTGWGSQLCCASALTRDLGSFIFLGHLLSQGLSEATL